MTDEQRRDREHRGLLVSTIAFVAALLADFFSNVFANYVRFPAGTANWLLRNWSQLAVGLTLIALIVFASRRFATERSRARADEAGPVQPDATFPPSSARTTWCARWPPGPGATAWWSCTARQASAPPPSPSRPASYSRPGPAASGMSICAARACGSRKARAAR
jgi:hypothetical protein